MDHSQSLWTLKNIGQEVEAMGHLLKFQQLDALQTEDVQAGIGRIIERLGQSTRRIIDRMEQRELHDQQRQHCWKPMIVSETERTDD